MPTIYVLKCRNGKYYVGKTEKTAMKRYKEHAAGNGCAWTRKYRPIELVECTFGDKFDEDKKTKQYIITLPCTSNECQGYESKCTQNCSNQNIVNQTNKYCSIYVLYIQKVCINVTTQCR